MARGWKTTVCGLVCLLGCVGAGELLLKLFLPFEASLFHLETQSELAQQTGWGPQLNASGSRRCDLPVPSSKKMRQNILLLGDSVLDCNEDNQRFEDSIPHHLSKLMGESTHITNLSAGGWGTDQQLIAFMEEGRHTAPEWVFLFFTPTNDVYNNLYWKALPEDIPKPYFTLDKLGHLQLHPLKIQTLPRTYGRWLARTEIGKRLLFIRQRFLVDNMLKASSHKNMIDTEFLSHLSAFATPPSPFINYGWKLTAEILRKLTQEVNRTGAKLAIVYVPSGIHNICGNQQNYPQDRCLGYKKQNYHMICLRQAIQLNTYQPFYALRKIAHRLRVPLVHNLDQVETFSENHREIAPDCLHLNGKGNRMLAKRVQEFLHNESEKKKSYTE